MPAGNRGKVHFKNGKVLFRPDPNDLFRVTMDDACCCDGDYYQLATCDGHVPADFAVHRDLWLVNNKTSWVISGVCYTVWNFKLWTLAEVRLRDWVVIETPPTRDCADDYCCPNYKRLVDCCTNADADLVVCSGFSDSSTVKYNGHCYYVDPMGTTYTLAEVQAAGWTIVTSAELLFLTENCYTNTECNHFFFSATAVCHGVDDTWPDSGFFGPYDYDTTIDNCAESPPLSGIIINKRWVQWNGHWYVGCGVLVSDCGYEAWKADRIADGTWLDTAQELTYTDPGVCCFAWQEVNSGPQHEMESPCCIQIIFSDFTCPDPYCPPAIPGETEWDGICASTYTGYAGPSVTCGSTGNYLPGTTCAVQARFDWDYVNLIWILYIYTGVNSYMWVGEGGNGAGDPTGTYTFTPLADLLTPGCGTLGGGNPQLGSGPTTLTVVRR